MIEHSERTYAIKRNLTDDERRRLHVNTFIAHAANRGFLESSTELATERPALEPREYQLDAWGSLWDARHSGADRGLIHLATGLGKTSVAVFDVMKFREEFYAKNERYPKVMFAVHQSEILDQAKERFGAFIPDATQGSYDGNTKDLDGDITFATFQSLHSNLEDLDSKTFDYIITDEVHHAKAPTYEKVVTHFKPEFHLGLTATPNRADEKDIRDLYGEELYSKDLASALSEGWLASPDYHIVFDDAVKKAMESGFGADSLSALKELFEVEPRNEVIAENIRQEMKKIGLEFGESKTIVFCQDIEHAEDVAELLGGKAYHSGLDKDTRTNIFKEFKEGDLQVIVTRDMFNEGVDVPDARVLVFLRSTKSETIFEQQLGRGLRKTEGKDNVTVLDFVANIERIMLVKQLADKVKSSRGLEDAGDEDENVDGDEGLGEGKGLHIGTNHGDFDFDKMAVDLLDRYSVLLEKLEGRNDLNELSNIDLVTLALELSPDRPLTLATINELSKSGQFVSGSTITKRFGSLPEFQKACGFEVINLKELSNIDLVTLALELSPDKPLSTTTINELSKSGQFASPFTITKRFGSLPEFQKACGFEVINLNELSNDDLVTLALELSPDKPLSATAIRELSKSGQFVSIPTITKRFGSLPEFQKACGFEVKESNDLNELSNIDLVTLALELSPDKPLSTTTINELSKSGQFVSIPAITRRFGSLPEFQKACGFEVINLKELSNDDLVTLALELSPDKPLSATAIRELSKSGQFASPFTITKRFGSLPEFQKACGFEVKESNDLHELSNDDLATLALELSPDRPLTLATINELSKSGQFVSRSTITRRFGSLPEFQKACGW